VSAAPLSLFVQRRFGTGFDQRGDHHRERSHHADLANWSKGAMRFISGSAAFPKVTEQPAGTGHHQQGPQRLFTDKLPAGASEVASFFSPLLTTCRSSLAHVCELLLGSVPDRFTHFLKVLLHFQRLFAQPFTCSRHVCFLIRQKV
jgi:hypothetical protein